MSTNITNKLDQLTYSVDLYIYVDEKFYDLTGKEIKDFSYQNRGYVFGFDSLSIEVNSSFQPIITINLIDYSGNTLFSKYYNNKSVYETSSHIFDWPPKKFLLSTKGFTGRRVNWLLNLKNLSLRYNSSNNSYEIELSFVPNLYGFFSDIPALFLLATKKLRNYEYLVDENNKYKIKGFEFDVNSVFSLTKKGKKLKNSYKKFEKSYNDLLELFGNLANARIFNFILTHKDFANKIIDGEINGQIIQGFKPIFIDVPVEFLDSFTYVLQNFKKENNVNAFELIDKYLLTKIAVVNDNNTKPSSTDYKKFLNEVNNVLRDGVDEKAYTTKKNQITLVASNNLELLKKSLLFSVYNETKEEIVKLTAAEVFSSITRDSAFLLGLILKYGFLGYKKNKESRDKLLSSKKIIGKYFPMYVKENGEEVPAYKTYFANENPDIEDYEMDLVNKIIEAIVEGLLENKDEGEIGEQGVGETSFNFITAGEIFEKNPYESNYINIAQNMLFRSAIVALVAPPKGPFVINDDSGEYEYLYDLAKKDLENVKDSILLGLTENDKQKLLDFCNAILNIYPYEGDEYKHTKILLLKDTQDGDKVSEFLNKAHQEQILAKKHLYHNNAILHILGVLDDLDTLFNFYVLKNGIDINELSENEKHEIYLKIAKEPTTRKRKILEILNEIFFNDVSDIRKLILDFSKDVEKATENFLPSDGSEIDKVFSKYVNLLDINSFILLKNMEKYPEFLYFSDRFVNNNIIYSFDYPPEFDKYIYLRFRGDSDQVENIIDELRNKVQLSPFEKDERDDYSSEEGFIYEFIYNPKNQVLNDKEKKRNEKSKSAHDSEVEKLKVYEYDKIKFNKNKEGVAKIFNNELFLAKKLDTEKDLHVVLLYFAYKRIISKYGFSQGNYKIFPIFRPFDLDKHFSILRYYAREIKRKLTKLETEKFKAISRVLGTSGDIKNIIYKQLHVIFNQWECIKGNYPIDDNSLERLPEEMEFSFSKYAYYNSLEIKKDQNKIKDNKISIFVFDFPLNYINVLKNNRIEEIKLSDAILNVEPLNLSNIDANTTALNLIQQISTKNNFVFYPISGDWNLIQTSKLDVPYPIDKVNLGIVNFAHQFYIIFSPSTNVGGVEINQDIDYQEYEEIFKNDPRVYNIDFGSPQNWFVKDIRVGFDSTQNTAESVYNLQALIEKEKINHNIITDCSMLPVYDGRSYTLNMELVYTPQVIPLQFFFLRRIPIFNGLYMCTKVNHTINASTQNTSVELIRLKYRRVFADDNTDQSVFHGTYPITLSTYENAIKEIKFVKKDYDVVINKTIVDEYNKYKKDDENYSYTSNCSDSSYIKASDYLKNKSQVGYLNILPELQDKIFLNQSNWENLFVYNSSKKFYNLNASKYFEPKNKIAVVLHHTAGGDTKGPGCYYEVARSRIEKENLSYLPLIHFVVKRDGKIWYTMPVEFWGDNSTLGVNNQKVIAIELESYGCKAAWGENASRIPAVFVDFKLRWNNPQKDVFIYISKNNSLINETINSTINNFKTYFSDKKNIKYGCEYFEEYTNKQRISTIMLLCLLKYNSLMKYDIQKKDKYNQSLNIDNLFFEYITPENMFPPDKNMSKDLLKYSILTHYMITEQKTDIYPDYFIVLAYNAITALFKNTRIDYFQQIKLIEEIIKKLNDLFEKESTESII